MNQECPAVPNGKKIQVECYNNPAPDQFDCLNRMDSHPGIFQIKIYQHQEDLFQLGKDLSYNSSGIFCLSDPKEYFIPWTKDGLDKLYYTSHCQSKKETGSKMIAGKTLWYMFFKDFGFRGRHHIPESYLYDT